MHAADDAAAVVGLPVGAGAMAADAMARRVEQLGLGATKTQAARAGVPLTRHS